VPKCNTRIPINMSSRIVRAAMPDGVQHTLKISSNPTSTRAIEKPSCNATHGFEGPVRNLDILFDRFNEPQLRL
jgi:hypothetical protein